MPIIKQKHQPQEYKQQIIERFLQNPDEGAIAREFNVSPSTVAKTVFRYFQSKPQFSYLN